MVIFLGFLYMISRWKDIRRVFEYHGAEHKVVFNFESGKPVNVENAQTFTTFHPRCGTSFLFVVMLVRRWSTRSFRSTDSPRRSRLGSCCCRSSPA